MNTKCNWSGPLERGIKIWRERGILGAGCYAVFDQKEQCLYVGGSVNVDQRICGHWRNAFDGSGVRWRCGGETSGKFYREAAPNGSTIKVWLVKHPEEVRPLEKTLIVKLRPKFNQVKPNGGKLPEGAKIVIVKRLGGDRERAMIVGESKDKTCWYVRLEGWAKKSRMIIHKSLVALESE